MVDRELILRKIADVEQYLQQLAGYRGMDVDTYRGDWKTQRIVERTLHLTIAACMDLADHIVADRRLPVPDTGAATFEILPRGSIRRPCCMSFNTTSPISSASGTRSCRRSEHLTPRITPFHLTSRHQSGNIKT